MGAASKSSGTLIECDRAVLLLVDLQEKLVPAVKDTTETLQCVRSLICGAGLFKVPIVVTEHCSDAIGHTVSEVLEGVSSATIIAKDYFCAAKEPGMLERLHSFGRDQVVVAGTETHVCVLQTALALLAQGYEVFVVADGTSCRSLNDKRLALSRLSDAGMGVVSTEMVLFEWAENGRAAEFIELLPIIKSLKAS